MIKFVPSLFFLGSALVSCGDSSGDSKDDENKTEVSLNGTLLLDNVIESATIELMVVEEKGVSQTQVKQDLNILTDEKGEFQVTISSSTLAINSVQTLMIKASKEPDNHLLAHHQNYEYITMWSYASDLGKDLTVNINMFTSIAYDIAVIDGDLTLTGIKAAELQTKNIFEIEADLPSLDQNDEKSIALGKIVKEIAESASVKVSAVIDVIAKDVSDNSIDGKSGEEFLTIGDNKVELSNYASRVSDIKSLK